MKCRSSGTPLRLRLLALLMALLVGGSLAWAGRTTSSLRARDQLGIGAGNCEILVHAAEVAEITGTGKRTREK